MSDLVEDPDGRLHLPKPRVASDQFLKLVSQRRSSREFSSRELEPQLLADLLWAAFGVSNQDGYRTAPSARNWREIDVYVALSRGLYRFDPHRVTLEFVRNADLREASGQQEFVAVAPVSLIFVADHARMAGASAKERDFYGAADTGVISQNVYLYCASAGLATVVRGLIDRPMLARLMNLRPDQRITLAQTVGYPSA